MAQKQRWAKMVNGRPQYAKTVEKIGVKWVANPTSVQLRKAGFKPYVDEFPSEEPEEGYHWEPNGWNDRKDRIERVYVQVQDAPPPPRIFSKYRLIAALMDAGVWDRVKAWVQAREGAWDLMVMALEIREDDRIFRDAVAAAKAGFGWTDADVEAILSQALA